jgi:hypothetical protein
LPHKSPDAHAGKFDPAVPRLHLAAIDGLTAAVVLERAETSAFQHGTPSRPLREERDGFSIPKLKQLIDAVTQKDLLFSFDERGLNGLLQAGRRCWSAPTASTTARTPW